MISSLAFGDECMASHTTSTSQVLLNLILITLNPMRILGPLKLFAVAAGRDDTSTITLGLPNVSVTLALAPLLH